MPCDDLLKYFVEVNGVKILIRDWYGNSSGGTCLLIHGLAEGGFVWDDFAHRISGRRRLVAVDLRGHGESDAAPQGKYSIDDMARDVIGVMAKMELGRCLLIGHSLGAVIALQIIDCTSADVEGAIIVDAGPSADRAAKVYLRDQLIEGFRPFSSEKAYVSWLAERRPLLASDIIDSFAQNSLYQSSDGNFWPRFDIKVADLLLEDTDEEWWCAVLSSVMHPALIIRGSGSAVLSRSICTKMVKLLQHGLEVSVPAAGHSVMNDNPEGFFRAVENFIFRRLVV